MKPLMKLTFKDSETLLIIRGEIVYHPKNFGTSFKMGRVVNKPKRFLVEFVREDGKVSKSK